MNTPLKLAALRRSAWSPSSAPPSASARAVGPVGPAADGRRARGHDMAADGHARGRRPPASCRPGGLLGVRRTATRSTWPTDALPAGAGRPGRLPDPRSRRRGRSPRYDESHDKELHLIVVRRDLAGFQHVHPALGRRRHLDDVPLDAHARAPGGCSPTSCRPPTARTATLGADLAVAGDVRPRAAAARRPATAEVDGYTVTLDGDLVPGEESELTLVGQPRRPAGHRPAALPRRLRAPGRAARRRPRLPARPPRRRARRRRRPRPAPTSRSTPRRPSAGTYRLFLDFQHGGAVRTAEFTVRRPQHVSRRPPAGRRRAAHRRHDLRLLRGPRSRRSSTGSTASPRRSTTPPRRRRSASATASPPTT